MAENDVYDALNDYLEHDTWAKGNPSDNERFYRALATIVRHPSFDPDRMGSYMRNVKDVTTREGNELIWGAIVHRVAEARAICAFLHLEL